MIDAAMGKMLKRNGGECQSVGALGAGSGWMNCIWQMLAINPSHVHKKSDKEGIPQKGG